MREARFPDIRAQFTDAPPRDVEDTSTLELSVVMPCLNESLTLAACVSKALDAMREHAIEGEVILVDNGSTDGSVGVATRAGARVIVEEVRGYGAALACGVAAARGQFVVMGDCDGSYDFSELHAILLKLREGYDLVVGNRFRGGIHAGAMPFTHRYLGNPVLSAIGRVSFHTPCGDIYCGLRGFRRSAVLEMELDMLGMEYALEMVAKASLFHLQVAEVPVTLSRDGRDRPPHLKTWRDGWRSLRFLLAFNPRSLFFYPGLSMAFIGLAAGL